MRPAARTHRFGDTGGPADVPPRGEAQAVGQAGAYRQPEHLAHARPAQVGVDQQHAALIRLAERQREVGRRQRLAFRRHRARHHHVRTPDALSAPDARPRRGAGTARPRPHRHARRPPTCRDRRSEPDRRDAGRIAERHGGAGAAGAERQRRRRPAVARRSAAAGPVRRARACVSTRRELPRDRRWRRFRGLRTRSAVVSAARFRASLSRVMQAILEERETAAGRAERSREPSAARRLSRRAGWLAGGGPCGGRRSGVTAKVRVPVRVTAHAAGEIGTPRQRCSRRPVC